MAARVARNGSGKGRGQPGGGRRNVNRRPCKSGGPGHGKGGGRGGGIYQTDGSGTARLIG